MNAQPVQPDTLLDDLHPSRFLKVTDLTERWKVTEMVIKITRVMREPTIPNPKDLDPETKDRNNPNGKPRVIMQPVLYFIPKVEPKNEFSRGYLVSSQVDLQSLKSATKATTSGELIGKKIVIILGEHRKQTVLRISAMPPME